MEDDRRAELLRRLPPELAQLMARELEGLSDQQAGALLDRLLQAGGELDYRPLAPADAAAIAARPQAFGFMPADLEGCLTPQAVAAPSAVAIGAFAPAAAAAAGAGADGDAADAQDGADFPVAFLLAHYSRVADVSDGGAPLPGVGAALRASAGAAGGDGVLGLRLLGVDLEYRRQGIGQELLTSLKQVASGLRASALWLFVSERNGPAVAFWRAAGFQALPYAEDAGGAGAAAVGGGADGGGGGGGKFLLMALPLPRSGGGGGGKAKRRGKGGGAAAAGRKGFGAQAAMQAPGCPAAAAAGVAGLWPPAGLGVARRLRMPPPPVARFAAARPAALLHGGAATRQLRGGAAAAAAGRTALL